MLNKTWDVFTNEFRQRRRQFLLKWNFLLADDLGALAGMGNKCSDQRIK